MEAQEDILIALESGMPVMDVSAMQPFSVAKTQAAAMTNAATAAQRDREKR
jgi:hypothetical protein